ncbi:Hypothetical predicted protein, partial [Olea europaea subsp. europaea]
GNLVSWSSKKQQTIYKSSTEVEYRSLINVTTENLWLHCLLTDLRVKFSKCNNRNSMVAILHYRIKHIELNLCFVREKVMWRKFDVCQAPSLDQTIDILTKAREKLTGSAAVRHPPHYPVLHTVEGKPVLNALEKRLTSQAQSRNDFFNLMRKKSKANSTSISDPGLPPSSTVSEKLGETQVSSAPRTTEARDPQSPVSSSGGHLSDEGGDLICNGDAIESQKCLCYGKKYPSSCPLFSEEEEVAFLRSMGWEENNEEGSLTQEEICAFYRDLQKYINSKPSLKILPVLPKILSPFNSQGIGVISSGLSSSDGKLES